MILHVAVIDKFIEPFIGFLEENFADFDRHIFFLFGDNGKYPVEKRSNVRFAVDRWGPIIVYGDLLGLMYSAEKIILHGLWNIRVVQLLTINSWLLKKCYWVIWGGDLYSYMLAVRDKGWEQYERYRRFVIKRMGHLVTYIDGDVKLAKKWYGARGMSHECLMYPSNVFKELKVPTKKSTTINIQIGNSADPSNEHYEMIEILEKYKDEDVRIYAPLSYGPKDHAYRVKEEGERIFGEKFIAMLDFIPYDEYLNFLGEIDIAFFNHRRQQAMGNTISLLGMGKKVYMRRDITSVNFLNNLGLHISSLDAFDLTGVSECDADRNNKIVSAYFSVSNLVAQWGYIFNERSDL